MCSNTSSSGGVISGSGGGGGGDYASLLLKKPKRQRVPKRGPGVAELEKILREQESTNINGHVVDKDSSCRISSQFPNSYHHHPQSSSNSFTRNVQNISNHNHFISPPAPSHITMLYANGGGSSMVLPEQVLFPAATWRSSCCESSNNIYGKSPKFPSGYPFSVNGSSDHHMHHHHHQHFPVMLQKKPCQYSSPSTMVGMKRPMTFTVDNNNLDSPFQFQVPTHFQHLNMPENSPSCDNQTVFNLKPNETVSRDHGGHFLIFGSRVASQQEFSKHNSLPLQETPERPNQVSLGQGGTVLQKKPFFSLLIPGEQIGEAETALTLNNERGRTRGEAIDLNLKL
ncbi:hypothetical protein LWI28_014432 [Acer negundo]|uniref:Uncharacterized protein n=1 Tax=Acer negundo TaxID=4023 RepID=A0AAD5JR41_ACENE|nr:hypothetical protein LWI28_014432 [Acer negundo]KAK4859001.1 hypothetical protein QYF36_025147 [Acer negundo]